MVKLEKVSKIVLDDYTIEREDSPQLPQLQKIEMDELKISYTAQQSEEIDNTIQHPWIKKNYTQPQCNESLVKNDIQNVSFEPNNSSFDLLIPKSIIKLKKKMAIIVLNIYQMINNPQGLLNQTKKLVLIIKFNSAILENTEISDQY
ncbi:unnamed protein product [Paramecium primaurelia]|uniref:Uncharacterized protein n=1 Tax=Paramecium primaurelia TaxID=5886 RepID=A0A8S1NT42_PARPR|nr:unnamed protein product [Paramecium primaurelia]